MPIEPFVLIVADHDRRVFSVEGPMVDDNPWSKPVVDAQDASVATLGTQSANTTGADSAPRRQKNARWQWGLSLALDLLGNSPWYQSRKS